MATPPRRGSAIPSSGGTFALEEGTICSELPVEILRAGSVLTLSLRPEAR